MSELSNNTPRQILMGGSGSTGSSLLKNILGRHPLIYGSQETSLFAKVEVYRDWSKAKRRLMGKRWWGLKNFGFHRYDRIDVYPKEHQPSMLDLKAILSESSDVTEFASRFFHRSLVEKEKQIWLEKTPANAALFRDFLDHFPEAVVIHTVRNPLDTIASLVSRGFDPYYATALYLLNTASGTMVKGHKRYIEIKYEDLVQQSEQTIQALCHRLNILYDDRMLEPQQEQHIETTILPGWHFNEVNKVESGSVGRFQKMKEQDRHLILQAIAFLRINDEGTSRYQLKQTTIDEIIQPLGYELPEIVPDRSVLPLLKKFKRKDQKYRLFHGYPFAIRHYPVDVMNI